jgi:hypothetical protein
MSGRDWVVGILTYTVAAAAYVAGVSDETGRLFRDDSWTMIIFWKLT